ncbi:bile acid:sodium symporter family protein [Shewanella sp. Scap07]|uniref:bile acid:sodium symporter family protein n=1 Tax=Shewanella sp. Scap07 TaxID=2589987 RepID=UPI0015B81930|nr:bile acid:sodium symporter family protein [Shewanella sp. Scap07]QLE86445.1 bile acid:sodium symporter family protein [Shewanella sp. Scap07]
MQTINRLFPLLALIGAACAYWQPQLFSGFSNLIVPLLVIIMLAMGLSLNVSDFTAAVRQYRAVGVGLVLQFSVMPLSALLISQLLGLDADLTLGLVVVGSVAGGTASNVVCYLAKGDLALSITMTACSTLLGVLLTPMIIELVAGQVVAVPVLAMLVSLAKIVLLPVIVGLLANHYLAASVSKIRGVLPWISVVAICMAITIIVALNAQRIEQIGAIVLLAVILHNASGLAFGYGVCYLLGFSHKVCRTISLEVGLQNSGLATALCVQFFSPASALPAAIFSVWHNLSGAMLAGYWSGKQAQDRQADKPSQKEA